MGDKLWILWRGCVVQGPVGPWTRDLVDPCAHEPVGPSEINVPIFAVVCDAPNVVATRCP